MTLDQVKLFAVATGKHSMRQQLAQMGTFRIAYHAEAKEYSKIIRDNERLLKRD